MLKKRVLVFILSCLCATAEAKNGIYVTVEGGIAKQTNLPSAESVGAIKSHESQPSAYRIGVGYNHDLYPCLGLGLDVAFGRYGKNEYDFFNASKTVRSSTSEYLLALQWHLQQWDLIGKAGGVRHKIKITKPIRDEDETQINLMTGLTAVYNFNSNWGLLASYNHVFGQRTNRFDILSGSTVSLQEYLLGVRYSF